jgi:hypothetical protein
MVNYNAKLDAVTRYIEDNFMDTADLCEWMGLTLEDVAAAFPDKLVEMYDEIYAPYSETESED